MLALHVKGLGAARDPQLSEGAHGFVCSFPALSRCNFPQTLTQHNLQAMQSKADAADVRLMGLEASLAKAQETRGQLEALLSERDDAVAGLQGQASSCRFAVPA